MSNDFLDQLRRDGVVRSGAPKLTPISGGVSSDILRLDDGGRTVVVKRALERLRVEQEWLADVTRNLAEQDYLNYVGALVPGAVPRLLHASRTHAYFVMEYLGPQFLNWKQRLLLGDCDPQDAARAGELLAAIHRHSQGDPAVAGKFATDANFTQLRVEPYLLYTGRQHAELRVAFEAEAARLLSCHEALVHGDFSPKNILIGDGRMVLLDCEVAWYGDPAFDLAFLINHLMLKALHCPQESRRFRAAIDAFQQAYRQRYEQLDRVAQIESRLLPLLPMLTLARVDGKSPVEYLNETQRESVRAFVRPKLLKPGIEFDEYTEAWFDSLERQ